MNITPLVLNLAKLYSANEEFKAFCLESFGREPDVYVDPVATAMLDFKCPYIALTPDTAETQEVSDSDTKSVRVLVCLDASLDANGNQIDTAYPQKTEDGYFISGCGGTLGEMVEKLTALTAGSTPGAIYQSATVDYNTGGQYPLQNAVITFSFKTYKSF